MKLLYLFAAAVVVGLDLYNGAIEPLDLPSWLNVLIGLGVGYGAVLGIRAMYLGDGADSDPSDGA